MSGDATQKGASAVSTSASDTNGTVDEENNPWKTPKQVGEVTFLNQW